MGRAAGLFQLAIVYYALLAPVYAIDTQRSGLSLPGVPKGTIGDDTRICRTLQLCHSSRTFALSTMAIFDAFESIAPQLQLYPLTEYIQVSQQGKHLCVRDSCCCSAPLEVQISIPINADHDESADLLHLAVLEDFVANKLPEQLAGAVCIGGLQECNQPISVERRKLQSVNPGVKYETAVIPVPDLPTGIVPGTTDIPESSAIAPVPDSGTPRLLATSSPFPGTYGEDNSNGSYGLYQQQAAADAAAAAEVQAASRSLLSEPSFVQSMKAKLSSCPPCPSCGSGSLSSSSGGGGQPALRLQQQLARLMPGSCYCRYDSGTATWALEDPACRTALYSKCGPTGSLLECASLEAYYSGTLHWGLDSEQQDLISAFLFVDCHPAPPCSCKAALAIPTGDSARNQCCRDLQAHCRVPFSGLDCTDVDRYCDSSSSDGDYLGMIYDYVAVKTHKVQCKDPRWAAAYSAQRSGMGPSAAVGGADGSVSNENGLRFAVPVMLTLMGSCLVAAVMLAGVISLVQHCGIKQCITPLPGDYAVY